MLRFALLLAVLAAGASPATAASCSGVGLGSLAVEGYVYGFPLVAMNYTRLLFLRTNPRTKINQIAHKRDLPTARDAEIVRPDTDALYSGAFLDLTRGPQLLEVAASSDPFLVTILDAWTNVRARTRGTGRQAFSIFGPGAKDTSKAKKGSTIVRLPTNMAWIYGRVPVKRGDLAAARRVQNGFRLTQLAGRPSSETAGTAPLLGVPSIRDYMIALDGDGFYRKLAETMCRNPPLPADRALVQRLQCLGFRPCKPWVPPSAAARKAVEAAARVGLPLVDAYRLTPVYKGWEMGISSEIGAYGTAYKLRAHVASTAIASNLPADAVLATTCVDAAGRPLDGSSAYRLRFAKAPPAAVYWAVSMYDTEGLLLDNRAQKFSVSSASGELVRGGGGGYELYFQPRQPAGEIARNWIPSPLAQPFCLTLRLYGPSKDVLIGLWEPPAVERSKALP